MSDLSRRSFLKASGLGIVAVASGWRPVLSPGPEAPRIDPGVRLPDLPPAAGVAKLSAWMMVSDEFLEDAAGMPYVTELLRETLADYENAIAPAGPELIDTDKHFGFDMASTAVRIRQEWFLSEMPAEIAA